MIHLFPDVYLGFAGIIDFMYYGEVEVPTQDISRFLAVAEQFQVRGLVEDVPKVKHYFYFVTNFRVDFPGGLNLIFIVFIQSWSRGRVILSFFSDKIFYWSSLLV